MFREVLLCRHRGGGRKGELELTCVCCTLLLFGAFHTAAQVHRGTAVIYLIINIWMDEPYERHFLRVILFFRQLHTFPTFRDFYPTPNIVTL